MCFQSLSASSRISIATFALALLAISSSAAHAVDIKLAVEPYLGYSQFSYRADSTASAAEGGGSNSVSDKKGGAVIGGKGGFMVSQTAWAGLDFHLGGPYLLDNNKDEYTNKLWGAGVGFVSPGQQRLWLGYYFDCTLDDIEHGVQLKGTAYKLSLGQSFDGKIAFNFEYVLETLNPAGLAGVFQLAVSVVYLSVSAPIALN